MPVTTRAMRVLVVDDYPDTVESTALLLKLGGHEIETAKDGVQAIERAASFRPDLVLLDLGLPALDGLAVARRIQDLALPPKPYLVAVSGYAKPQDKRFYNCPVIRCGPRVQLRRTPERTPRD